MLEAMYVDQTRGRYVIQKHEVTTAFDTAAIELPIVVRLDTATGRTWKLWSGSLETTGQVYQTWIPLHEGNPLDHKELRAALSTLSYLEGYPNSHTGTTNSSDATTLTPFEVEIGLSLTRSNLLVITNRISAGAP
jgi:hypothetical protein